MIKPNLFGILGDALENASSDDIASVTLVFCIAGFWAYTGSLLAALALTLLAIVPLALLVSISTFGFWISLRLLDGATKLIRRS